MGRTLSADPLALVALACRRGPQDLRALAQLARGQAIDAEHALALQRAGLLRASPAGPKLPASLIAPVLALDAAVGGQGDQLLRDLVGLLAGAEGSQRDLLLDALHDQLADQLSELRREAPAGPPADELLAVLNDLQQATARLQDQGLSVSRATRLAALCAQLVEQLAHHAQPRRRRPARAPLAVSYAHAVLAARGRTLSLCRPLRLPDPRRLAVAALTSQLPPVTERHAELERDPRRSRAEQVRQALQGPDPLQALYGGADDPVEALRRHGALVALGEEVLHEAQLTSSGRQRPGPAPLAWSSALEALVARQRLAA